MSQLLEIMIHYQIMSQKLFKNYTCITFFINNVLLILTVAERMTAKGILKTDNCNQNRRTEEEVENMVAETNQENIVTEQQPRGHSKAES